MLRATALALAAATIIGSAPLSAQTIDLGGRGGPSIDLRSERQKDRDFRREQAARDREFDRREEERDRRRAARRDRDLATGSTGCREITVRERDDFGRTVTRTRREC